MNTTARILIIGGGPAGASCAIQLRQEGARVELAEQQRFPRNKVCGCCIGGAGLAVLESMGMREQISSVGAAIDTWRGSIGSHLATLSLPAGVAISRELLDTCLLAEAESHGAVVMRQCRAKIIDSNDQRVTVCLQRNDQTENRHYDCVIVAAGLGAAGVSRFLPWIQPPSGPFGVSFTAPADTPCDSGVIYMACDEDGYVGVVRLENGVVDVAAALVSGAVAARRGTPGERVLQILRQSRFTDLSMNAPAGLMTAGLMTTPPLRRRRLPGKGRILAIGDALGYVEPFTGEGMTWAMQSGISVANDIVAAKNGLSNIGQCWTQTYSNFSTRNILCRTVTTALRWSPARYVAGRVLSTWPALASPLVGRLNSQSIVRPNNHVVK